MKAIHFESLIKQDRQERKQVHFSGTLLDYLDIIQHNPKHCVLSHQRMYDLLTTPGIEVIKTEENEVNKAEVEKAELINLLAVYPKHLTVKQLIKYRALKIENWLACQRTPSHTPTKALEIVDSAINNKFCGYITLGVNTDDGTINTIDGSSRINDFINYYFGAIIAHCVN